MKAWSHVCWIVVCALVGAAGAFLGMLPWLVHGARLVPQNLWAVPVDAAAMPIVLLPFSQYQLDLVAGIVLVGDLIGGVCARLLLSRGVWGARPAVLGGLLAVHLVALIQTAVAVSSGLHFVGGVGLAGGAGVPDDAMAYLIAVCAWIILAMAIGSLAFVLLTTRSAAPFPLGAALVAVVLEPWARGFLVSLTAPQPGPASVGLVIAGWLPAVLLGAAIGWMGVWVWRRASRQPTPAATEPTGGDRVPAHGRVVSVGRIVSGIAALVVLWLGTSVLTGVVSAAGSRALLRLPDELVRLAGSVTAAELRGDALTVTIVAAALSVLGVAVHEAISRSTHRTTRGSEPLPEPERVSSAPIE